MPARLHWPFLANLRVNGRPLPGDVPAVHLSYGESRPRPSSRGAPESFSTGNNTLTIQAQDVRPFSVLVRVAKRRTLDEVKAAVPAPLSFPMARAHLERELGGGGGGGSDDSDDDLIVQDNAVLSLRCPISGYAGPLLERSCARGWRCLTWITTSSSTPKFASGHVRTVARPAALGRHHRRILDPAFSACPRARIHSRRRGTRPQPSRVEVEPSGRWRPCPEDNSSKTNDAAWVSAEAMNGVVLGVGGSVLHVPPELLSVSMNGETKSAPGRRT